MKHNKIINTIHTLAIASGLFGFMALGNAQAQTYRDRDNDGLIEISNIEQLDSIRYNLGSKTGKVACGTDSCTGYELTRNLDFRDSTSYRNYRSYISGTHDSSFYAWGEGWRPVGTATYVNGNLQEGNPFNTLFEGNRFTLDHLFINRVSTHFVGLFGYTRYTQSNSSIRNIGLRTVSVTGNNFVGGLVGWDNGTIIQSYATGAVTGTDHVGGLVGWNNGVISQSYATGAVSSASYIGGLVGSNDGTISQCSATGDAMGSQYVGGLVGINWSGGTTSQSYATGTVSGTTYVGGLVGGNGGTISQSYATGAVTGTDHVGGLVGWNNGVISQSYATGAVSGTQFVGGLIGINYNGTVHHGYWDLDAAHTVVGTARTKNNKLGIGSTSSTNGTAIQKYILGLTLSALRSPTGTAVDSIRELGPGFLYYETVAKLN